MKQYKIADLNVSMNNKFPRVSNQSEKYKTNFESSHIEINLTQEHFNKLREIYPNISDEISEYMLGAVKFAKEITNHNGFVLHASAVAVDGNAYLFSARSGTGKSTHTSLWLDHFKDRALIINDDKPCIILCIWNSLEW